MSLEKEKTFNREVSLLPVLQKNEIFIWSLPTRIFHWFLVATILASAITSFYENLLNIHMSLGFIAVFIVFWRIYYGFHGPFFSRFRSFIFPAARVKSYLKELAGFNPPEYTGHNPPHGWMILAFFAVIFLSLITGTIILSGEENEGFLAVIFSYSTGENSKTIHKGLAYLFGGMVFFHLSGVFLDSVLHETNLVKGMITGKKRCGANAIGRTDLAEDRTETTHGRTKGLLWLSAASMLTAGLFFTTISASSPDMELPYAGTGFEIWKTECSDCHELFHPSLLPGRSWEEMTGRLDSHFGEDASIEKESEGPLLRFLLSHSADNSDTEAAFKIRSSLPGNKTVIRITDTPYWQQKHREIGGEVYARRAVKSKTHCKACHSDALSGGYKDRMITVPAA